MVDDLIPGGGVYPPEDVAEGKLFGILSYVTCGIIAILSLVQKSNAFALFHAKQALGLGIAMFAIVFPLSVISMVVSWLSSFLGLLVGLVGFVPGLAGLALAVFGAFAASKGQYAPLPFIGPKIEELFKSIQKEG
ncbi:MAG: DUF4870 domain-containing protein [Planctomycetes bacterium]|nr:DUF4870 domain-containing protein [Planctomycetota bacterium]